MNKKALSLFALVAAFYACKMLLASPLLYKGEVTPIEKIIDHFERELSVPKLGPNLTTNFHLFGNSELAESQLILIPDQHNEAFSALIQGQIIGELSGPGDIVLMEIPREVEGVRIKSCERYSIVILVDMMADNIEAFGNAVLKSEKIMGLRKANQLWPSSKLMTCAGWDSKTLQDRHNYWSDQFESTAHSRPSMNDMALRKKIVKSYGLSLAELGLENPLKDEFSLFLVNFIAATYVRNAHMVQTIEEYRTKSPGSRVFLVAGAGHLPPACMGDCQIEKLRRVEEISRAPLDRYLEGQKYIVLAHKNLFKDPRLPERNEL